MDDPLRNMDEDQRMAQQVKRLDRYAYAAHLLLPVFAFWMGPIGCAGIAMAQQETTIASAAQALREARLQTKRTASELYRQGSLTEREIDVLSRILIEPTSERTRLLVPISTTRSGSPVTGTSWARPGAAAQSLLESLATAYLKYAETCLQLGEMDEVFRSQMAGVLLDRTIEPPSTAVANQIDAFRHRQVHARASVPLPDVGWKAGSYTLIESPNFQIYSQAPSKVSSEIIDVCEESLGVWQQIFFHWWSSNDPLEKQNATKTDSNAFHRADSPFRVILFRNRNEYVERLRSIEPKIEVSTGYYSPTQKTTYLYWGDPKSQPTLRHELTHQFFAEAGRLKSNVPMQTLPGIWAVEGIAMYMESMAVESGLGFDVVDIGGWDSPRLQAARYRRIHDESWIPWSQMSVESADELKKRSDIAMWYSQSAGLTHQWMDGEPRARKDFLKYLESVYRGQPQLELLQNANDEESLLQQYDRFLTVDESIVRKRTALSQRTDVVLSRLDIQSATLLAWPQAARKLEWLDLSFTAVDDQIFLDRSTSNKIPDEKTNGWRCIRLNLEGTQVTDASLKRLFHLDKLVELDLSGCSISDTGIGFLKGHRNLQILWLTGTSVSDQSIEVLASIKSLEYVNLDQTQVSPAGVERLRKSLPKWKRKP